REYRILTTQERHRAHVDLVGQIRHHLVPRALLVHIEVKHARSQESDRSQDGRPLCERRQVRHNSSVRMTPPGRLFGVILYLTCGAQALTACIAASIPSVIQRCTPSTARGKASRMAASSSGEKGPSTQSARSMSGGAAPTPIRSRA